MMKGRMKYYEKLNFISFQCPDNNQNYQMNSSFSEDVLQKMRLQQKKSQYLVNPQKMLTHSFAVKTQYIGPSHSPKQITYNQIIHDGESKRKGRYKLRNCRQPNLKVVQRKSLSREKANSLLGLKQLMRQQMQRYSIKKKYENVLQNYANNEIAENLKLDLLFLPNTVKIPHRNRYRPNKQIPQQSNSIAINGSKIVDGRMQLPINMNMNMNCKQEGHDFPDIAKRTAGFQLKYRKYYLNRKQDVSLPRNGEKERERDREREREKEEEQFPPLTGWM